MASHPKRSHLTWPLTITLILFSMNLYLTPLQLYLA